MKNGHGVYTWADGIRFDGQVRSRGRLRLQAQDAVRLEPARRPAPIPTGWPPPARRRPQARWAERRRAGRCRPAAGARAWLRGAGRAGPPAPLHFALEFSRVCAAPCAPWRRGGRHLLHGKSCGEEGGGGSASGRRRMPDSPRAPRAAVLRQPAGGSQWTPPTQSAAGSLQLPSAALRTAPPRRVGGVPRGHRPPAAVGGRPADGRGGALRA